MAPRPERGLRGRPGQNIVIAELGSLCLVLALCLSLAQSGMGWFGGRRPALAGGAEGAAYGALIAAVLAFAALVYAFVTSDFSVQNVADNSHPDQPLFYKVAAAWGSHEGSMVMWCMDITIYGAAVALFGRNLPRGLKSKALATQGAIAALYIAYTLFASNPLMRLATPPVEGAPLNPVLQDPLMAIHPPILYLGYVGFSVVFSFCVAALLEKRVDSAWARWVRPWTLLAWSFQTVGITLGSFWAYYELGWGGWWAWDPVENASFMPWLIGTALLHSAIVTEKRGALPGWTVFLGLATFTFSMLGAVLVRSGVLTSVHSFAADPARGALLIGILVIVAGSAFTLFAIRFPSLPAGGAFAPISRESGMVLNNIFLTAATATVALGTLYPIIGEALGGQTVSVGTPYFNLTFAPLMALLAIVVPAGALLSWKRGDARGLSQRLWLAAVLAIVAGLISIAINSPRNAMAAVGVALGAWLIVGSLIEVAERIKLFRAPMEEVRRRVFGLPRGAWGMTLAHIGLGVIALGACFETAYKITASEVLTAGQSMQVGAYQLTLNQVAQVDGPNYEADEARLTVHDRSGRASDMTAANRFFASARPGAQTTTKVGLSFRGIDDLFVSLGDERPNDKGELGRLIVAHVNPWIRLVFLGPLLMALGGALSLSDRRLRLAAGARR
ncbi:MAG: cycK [Caulobacteraceae bacterium]|nr:cycK [Caulobacteraceae bacterium]